MVEKKLFYVRKFLNKKGYHSMASIIASVTRETHKNGSYRGNTVEYYTEFLLSDCSRQIQLAFDVCDKEERKNTLAKLDILCSSLEKFREEIVKACEEMDELDKKKKEKK